MASASETRPRFRRWRFYKILGPMVFEIDLLAARTRDWPRFPESRDKAWSAVEFFHFTLAARSVIPPDLARHIDAMREDD